MTTTRKAYFVGGVIGSLAGAAFLIRDGGMPGANISIFEAGRVMGVAWMVKVMRIEATRCGAVGC